jgi:hypothetical protein
MTVLDHPPHSYFVMASPGPHPSPGHEPHPDIDCKRGLLIIKADEISLDLSELFLRRPLSRPPSSLKNETE